MDKATVIEHIKAFADLVRKDFDVRSILLFGSYARGTAHEYSDIDVAVVLDKLDDEWLSTAIRLYKMAESIDINIEPVILLTSHDESGFLEHVMKTGEIIYNHAA
jgi:predicted nucleotidyltransferase